MFVGCMAGLRIPSQKTGGMGGCSRFCHHSTLEFSSGASVRTLAGPSHLRFALSDFSCADISRPKRISVVRAHVRLALAIDTLLLLTAATGTVDSILHGRSMNGANTRSLDLGRTALLPMSVTHASPLNAATTPCGSLSRQFRGPVRQISPANVTNRTLLPLGITRLGSLGSVVTHVSPKLVHATLPWKRVSCDKVDGGRLFEEHS